MKKIFYLLAAVIFTISACTEADNVMDGTVEGGLLDVTTASINYVVGDAKDYTVEFKVFQAEDMKTTKVEAYISFYTFKRNADGTIFEDADEQVVALSSNEILFKTIDITETKNHFVTFDVGFDELIVGLNVEGTDYYTTLPTSDGDYLIGDYWALRFVNTTSDGNVHENYKQVNISVSTRFAGKYLTTASEYLHPTAGNLGDWNGIVKSVQSVDAITYKLLYIASWEDEPQNILYFQIGADDKVIVLKEYNGKALTLWGADPVGTCEGGDLPLIDCANSNYVEKKADGADIIHIAYGYVRSTGTRQFSETLVKVID